MIERLGFDNEKYLEMQSEHIRSRIDQFGGKLYLEFGGKLFDDNHASRVLPGFHPDSKIRMLMQLKDQVEIVVAVSAMDLEKSKVRGDLGITYGTDTLRLIDAFRGFGFPVGSVVLTRFSGQPAAEIFQSQLEALGLKVYRHYSIEGYPYDIPLIVSEEGYGDVYKRQLSCFPGAAHCTIPPRSARPSRRRYMGANVSLDIRAHCVWHRCCFPLPPCLDGGHHRRFFPPRPLGQSVRQTGPVLRPAGLFIVVGIGGLDNVVISPIRLRYIRELAQLVLVAVHIVLVRRAAQHPVDDGGHFGTGNGVVRAESPVLIAVDPAIPDRANHLVIEPVAGIHIGKDVLAAGIQVGKPHGNDLSLIHI